MLIRMTLSNLTVHYAKTEDLSFAGGGMLNNGIHLKTKKMLRI